MLSKSIIFLLKAITIFFVTHIAANEAKAQFLKKEKPYSDHYNSSAESKSFFNPWAIDKNEWYHYWTMYFYEGYDKWPNLRFNSLEAPSVRPLPAQIHFYFIGHSTFYIQLDGVQILTDPVFSDKIGPVKFFGFKRTLPVPTQPEFLPGVDLVLISNNKYDHLDIESLQTLERLFHPQFIVPVGVGVYLKKHKIKNVVELDWFEKSSVKDMQVTMMPSQSSSGRLFNDRNNSLWGSYVLQTPQLKSIYYIGESGSYDKLSEDVKKQFPGFDMCLFPIGAYEPKWHMGYYNMNLNEALAIAEKVSCKSFVGHRFGTFQIGAEKFDESFNDLTQIVQQNTYKFPIVYPSVGKNYFYPDKL